MHGAPNTALNSMTVDTWWTWKPWRPSASPWRAPESVTGPLGQSWSGHGGGGEYGMAEEVMVLKGIVREALAVRFKKIEF